MGESIHHGRRTFLKSVAAAGGSFVLGFQLPAHARAELPDDGSDAAFAPNAWIRIDPDETVTLMVASSEMGQGVMTSIPMLAAEELEADWSRVRAEFAPAAEAYYNPLIGRQLTGGSTAIRGFWNTVREAGATAKEMLIEAAAQRWDVSPGACQAHNGHIIHLDSDKKASFGSLAADAAQVPVPETVFLKEPEEFRLLGKPRKRLDTPQKVDGSAVFGQDVALEGLKTATIARCPVFGGTLESFDDSRARQVKGVIDVFEVTNGVAVVADSFWQAKKGRDALDIQWDLGEHRDLDSEGIRGQFREAVTKGKTARNEGDAPAALGGAENVLEATFEVPYLAHACMEPMNATAHVRNGRCDIWAPTQGQTGTQDMGMAVTGLPREKVFVHTTFLGGGFGRRSETDFIRDAVEVSRQSGHPVKVIWTREDTTRHDFYRPATHNRFRAVLNEDGMPQAWHHQIAGPSIQSRRAPGSIQNGIDPSSVEGAANLPYAIENLRVDYAMVNPGVPVGYWRSVGSSQNAFVTECFMDEVARAGGQDPFELRRQFLANHPRHRGVLELAAEKADWEQDPPAGRHRGIAVAESFGSFCAQVAEVSVDRGRLRVHRVVCAIDCGLTANPSTIEAQMQSGIVYGLTAALHGEITLKDGQVQQGNFDDYPALRIDEMPEVEVHIVDSDQPPGGVGEPGTPPIAPAVANAVFAATGKPVRQLPIRL